LIVRPQTPRAALPEAILLASENVGERVHIISRYHNSREKISAQGLTEYVAETRCRPDGGADACSCSTSTFSPARVSFRKDKYLINPHHSRTVPVREGPSGCWKVGAARDQLCGSSMTIAVVSSYITKRLDTVRVSKASDMS